MLLVDSTVWVDYFNGHITPQSDYLDNALASQALMPLLGIDAVLPLLGGRAQLLTSARAQHSAQPLRQLEHVTLALVGRFAQRAPNDTFNLRREALAERWHCFMTVLLIVSFRALSDEWPAAGQYLVGDDTERVDIARRANTPSVFPLLG